MTVTSEDENPFVDNAFIKFEKPVAVPEKAVKPIEKIPEKKVEPVKVEGPKAEIKEKKVKDRPLELKPEEIKGVMIEKEGKQVEASKELKKADDKVLSYRTLKDCAL